MSGLHSLATQLNPFGLQPATGELVDVSEVPAGLACACICPQCSTPLIARRGEEKAWHFAHESRGEAFKTTARQCENSLFVSLKLMSRQVLKDATALRLPPVAAEQTVGGVTFRSELRPEKTLDVARLQIEHALHGFLADAVITPAPSAGAGRADVATPLLAVVFDYPGRDPIDLADEEEAFAESKSGAIVISLPAVWAVVGRHHKGFRQALSTELLDRCTGKRWEFHPLLAQADAEVRRQVTEARARVAAAAARVPARSPVYRPEPRPTFSAGALAPRWYGCRRCRLKFACAPPMSVGGRAGAIYCLNCREGGLADLGAVGPGVTADAVRWDTG